MPLDKSMWAQQNRLRAERGEPPLPPPKKRPPPEYPRPAPSATPSTHAALALSSATPRTDATPSIPATPTQQPETEYRRGDSRINHDFFDKELCGRDPLAQLLYVHLNRYRAGGSNLTIVVSWKRLTERIPVHPDTLRRAYKRLKSAGLVEKVRDVVASGGTQGMIFRLSTGATPSASATPRNSATHNSYKKKDNIEKDIKEVSLTTEEIAEYERATGRKWEG